jgi:single-strand DNA-binding protein
VFLPSLHPLFYCFLFFRFFFYKTTFFNNQKSKAMEIIGRVTADAKVKALPHEREVVNFSIAINDSYKPKGAKEAKKVVTYVDCSYWLGTNIAQYITKGTIIQLSGSIAARAWVDSNNEPRAGLNFHVNMIKLHGGGKQDSVITEPPIENVSPVDDLPF